MERSDIIELSLPADYRYLNIVGAAIAALIERIEGLDEPEITSYNLQLVAQEACANIVGHAYNNQPDGRIHITVTVESTPPRVLIDLDDTGEPFEPESIPEPDLDDAQVHGYGLFLMRHLLDEVTYYPGAGNNRWHLVKNL